MTLSHLVNPSQRWRVIRGMVPSCPVGSYVSLVTNDYWLEVSRPPLGVVAKLDLRNATIAASTDGHELTFGTATGEVVFQNDDALGVVPSPALTAPGLAPAPQPVPGAALPAKPDPASFVGQVVQFGAIAPNADGWNLFAFLVMRRVNGWLLGLTQGGHPAGIAEHNIAWAQVLDRGPRQASDRLVLTYLGQRRQCDRAFEAEAPTLRELGYVVTNQQFLQESRSPASIIAALLVGLLLAFILIGLALIAWLILVKPPGILTVTLHRAQG
jgi:hypothetical protein